MEIRPGLGTQTPVVRRRSARIRDAENREKGLGERKNSHDQVGNLFGSLDLEDTQSNIQAENDDVALHGQGGASGQTKEASENGDDQGKTVGVIYSSKKKATSGELIMARSAHPKIDCSLNSEDCIEIEPSSCNSPPGSVSLTGKGVQTATIAVGTSSKETGFSFRKRNPEHNMTYPSITKNGRGSQVHASVMPQEDGEKLSMVYGKGVRKSKRKSTGSQVDKAVNAVESFSMGVAQGKEVTAKNGTKDFATEKDSKAVDLPVPTSSKGGEVIENEGVEVPKYDFGTASGRSRRPGKRVLHPLARKEMQLKRRLRQVNAEIASMKKKEAEYDARIQELTFGSPAVSVSVPPKAKRTTVQDMPLPRTSRFGKIMYESDGASTIRGRQLLKELVVSFADFEEKSKKATQCWDEFNDSAEDGIDKLTLLVDKVKENELAAKRGIEKIAQTLQDLLIADVDIESMRRVHAEALINSLFAKLKNTPSLKELVSEVHRSWMEKLELYATDEPDKEREGEAETKS